MKLAGDLLIVDAGNTKTLVVLYGGGRETLRCRIVGAEDAARSYRAACGGAAELGGTGIPALVASVTPRAAREAERALRRAGWKRPHHAAWDDPWPFALAVRQPWTVGVDRLANVAGLRALGYRSGIAIDVGTAATCDVLDGGVFTGGLILPGTDLAARALHRGTARLPYVAVGSRPPRIGRDTRGAVAAGVYHGTFEGLAAIARRLQTWLGKGAAVVATGGQGEGLADLGPPACRHVPDLTLLGLRLLAVRLFGSVPRNPRKTL